MFYGIRFNDREFAEGEELPKSYHWEDNVKTDIQLDGTCAIAVPYDEVYDDEEPDWLAISKEYFYGGKHLYVLISDYIDYGLDKDEIVMKNAKVYKKIY